MVGICDTPAELTDRVVALLYLDPGAVSVGWSGINHLGWLTALHEADPTGAFPPENHLENLFGDRDRLLRIHRDGLFETSEMAGAIPSEYVFLHLHPDRAVERIRAAGTTRGAAILELEGTLFAALAAAGNPEQARAGYREFTHARDASYFRIEARGDASAPGSRPRRRRPERLRPHRPPGDGGAPRGRAGDDGGQHPEPLAGRRARGPGTARRRRRGSCSARREGRRRPDSPAAASGSRPATCSGGPRPPSGSSCGPRSPGIPGSPRRPSGNIRREVPRRRPSSATSGPSRRKCERGFATMRVAVPGA